MYTNIFDMNYNLKIIVNVVEMRRWVCRADKMEIYSVCLCGVVGAGRGRQLCV